uniref:Uncharacterized protein n=2 Tax=Amphimedon queenslandica TaxID=400682 RepID=A0A1X7U0H0_AMPQE
NCCIPRIIHAQLNYKLQQCTARYCKMATKDLTLFTAVVGVGTVILVVSQLSNTHETTDTLKNDIITQCTVANRTTTNFNSCEADCEKEQGQCRVLETPY